MKITTVAHPLALAALGLAAILVKWTVLQSQELWNPSHGNSSTPKELRQGTDSMALLSDVRTNFYNISVYIDVASFAEGIGGWSESLVELLALARAVGGVLVEPCMTNGRLGSCFDYKVPIGKIFDLSGAKMMKFDEYQRQRQKMLLSSSRHHYHVCADIKSRDERCGDRALMLKDVKATKLRIDTQNKSAPVILKIDDYWRDSSIRKFAKLFDVKVDLSSKRLRFHPKIVREVDDALHASGILDSTGGFSAVHWRAEKEGMDFDECAAAVASAKHAMLQGTSSQERANDHKFLLMTSLNKDPDMMWSGSRRIAVKANEGPGSPVSRALDFLLKDEGFLKVDNLMLAARNARAIDDPGMLAVYDLILATKARQFATCARDGGMGCNNSIAQQLCQRCNHVGKFGRLALSLRGMDRLHGNDASWGCWPQAY